MKTKEIRSYKVTKTEWYKEEERHLYSSYNFKYFSEVDNEWNELRYVSRIEELKMMVIKNPDLIGTVIELPRVKI